MKRLITLLAALSICAALSAQQVSKVTTRKYRFSDFTDKITKVVMAGGEILDGALRQEVVDGWTPCRSARWKEATAASWYTSPPW